MNAWFDMVFPGWAEPAWRLAGWQLAGWTMLHFLWLGTVAAIIGGGVRLAVRRASPNTRYAASLMTLAVLAVLPAAIAVAVGQGYLLGSFSETAIATASDDATERALADAPASASRRDAATWGRLSETAESESRRDSATTVDLAHADAGAVIETKGAAGVGVADATLASPSLHGRGMAGALDAVVAYLPWAWVVGAPGTFALLAAGLVGSRRLRSRSTAIVDGPVVDACRRLQAALGVTRRVALAACDHIVQPVLVGILRPTILLPAAALTGWSPEELEMVLAHELAHVRRWDNLVNLAQRLVESLLFFHPCVWLASRQVRRDREECCDALVVRHTARPEAYATLLVSIAAAVRARRAPQLAAASAMADHPLAGRVRRILKLEDETMRVSRRSLAVVVAALLAVFGGWYYHAAQAEETDPNRSGAATENADVDDNDDVSPRELTKDQIAEIKTLQKANEIPAAVLVFPVSPDVVSQRVRELNSLGHNVRVANGDRFTVLFVPRLEPYAEPQETLEAEIDLLQRSLVRDLERWGSGHPAIKQREALIAALEQELRGTPAAEQTATLDDLLAVLERVKATHKAKLEEWKQNAAGDKELQKFIEEQEVLAQELERKIQQWQDLQTDAEQGDDGAEMPKSLRDASPGVADEIERLWAQVFDGIVEGSDEYQELERLRAAIGGFLEKRLDIARELVELEVFWQQAQQSGPGNAALERRVAEVLEKDPSIAMYQQQLFELNQQIQLMERSAKNLNNTTLKRLRQQYAYTEAAMKSYQSTAEDEARKKLRSLPNEALRSAYEEFRLRKVAARARASALEQQFDKHLRTLKGNAEESSERAQLVQALRRQLDLLKELAPQDAISAPPVPAQPGDHAMPLTLMEPLPAGLSEDDGHRIVDELNDAGHRARLLEEGGAFAIAVTPQPVRDEVEWQAVWEEDSQGMHCRLLAWNANPPSSQQEDSDGDASVDPQQESADGDALRALEVELWSQIQEARAALTRERARWGEGHPSVKLLANALAELEQRWKEKEQAFGQSGTRGLDFRLPEWMTNDDARRLVRELRDQGYAATAVLADDGIRLQVPEFPADLDLFLDVESSGGKREFKLRVAAKEQPAEAEAPADEESLQPPADESPDQPAEAGSQPLWREAPQESADDAPQSAPEPGLEALFAVSDVNPLVTQVHHIPPSLKQQSIDELGFDELAHIFDDMKSSLSVSAAANLRWRWLVEGEVLEITAPQLYQSFVEQSLQAYVATLDEHEGGDAAPAATVDQQFADALAVLEQAEGGDADAASTLTGPDVSLVQLLFREGPENPVETVVYSGEDFALPKGFAEPMSLYGDAINGLRTDPYGPRAEVDCEVISAGLRLRVTAPRAGHRYVKFFVSHMLSRGNRGPLLSADDQAIADLAYRTLGVEVEPLVATDEERTLLNEFGFGGGVRIIGVRSGAAYSWTEGDILAGIHTWPVADMAALGEVLGRDELAGLSPVKCIVAAPALRQKKVVVRLEVGGGEAGRLQSQYSTLPWDANAGSDGNPSPSPSLRGSENGEPHRLAAGDVVLLRVVGTLPDQPIDSHYTIEAEGTIPLGPAYGRATVAGLTLLEAEEAIKQHLKSILTNVELQLTMLEPATHPVEPTRMPRLLQTGDQVHIHVAGTFPDWPLKGDYAVESEGAVYLGRPYGRVAVVGMSIQEAEAAITARLKKFLKQPMVQVTLVAAMSAPAEPADGAGVANPSASPSIRGTEMADGAVLLYDGKTFDEWQVLWKSELKVERRMEAIEALVAFARSGMGREAVEAIFDIAVQYDFAEHGSHAEAKLKDRVIELLATNRSQRVEPSIWLPALRKRLEADAGRWRELAARLLKWVNHENRLDEPSRQMLLEMAADARFGPSVIFLRPLFANGGDEDEQITQLLRQALTGPDKENAILALSVVGFGDVDRWPEAFALLFDDDENTRRQARTLLAMYNKSDQASTLVAKLVGVLKDSQLVESHVPALQALAVLNEHLRQGSDVVEVDAIIRQILKAGESQLDVPAGAVILSLFEPPWEQHVDPYLQQLEVPADRRAEIRAAWIEGVEAERERLTDPSLLNRL